MTRPGTLVLILGLFSGPTAGAHFVFIVPDGIDASTGKVVFSNAPAPDRNIDVSKIKSTHLNMTSAAGERSALDWTPAEGEGFYKIDVPGSGVRYVTGTTDYGVSRLGEGKAFWLQYHPKAVFGPVPEGATSVAGDGVPVEVVPVVRGREIRFRALVNGKPAETSLRVAVPGDQKPRNLETDAEGLSPAFDKPGTYAVVLRHVEETAGVRLGQSYEEVRHYATLVAILGE